MIQKTDYFLILLNCSYFNLYCHDFQILTKIHFFKKTTKLFADILRWLKVSIKKAQLFVASQDATHTIQYVLLR